MRREDVVSGYATCAKVDRRWTKPTKQMKLRRVAFSGISDLKLRAHRKPSFDCARAMISTVRRRRRVAVRDTGHSGRRTRRHRLRVLRPPKGIDTDVRASQPTISNQQSAIKNQKSKITSIHLELQSLPSNTASSTWVLSA